MLTKRFAAALALATVTAVASLGAQGTLHGMVVDDSTDRPIAGAEVAIPALNLVTLSNSEGKYRLSNVPTGLHDVVVRHLGYTARSARVGFRGEEYLERDFLLAVVRTAIAGVTVTGKTEPVVRGKLAVFAERRKQGIGTFLDTADLARDQGRRLPEALARVPGMKIVQAKTGSAAWAATRRGQSSIDRRVALDPMDRAKGASAGDCYVAVVLDGVDVYGGNGGQALFDIASIPVSSIAAIEFYAGGARTPTELNKTRSGTCGVLVIWTR